MGNIVFRAGIEPASLALLRVVMLAGNGKILDAMWCILDTPVIDFYIVFYDRSLHYTAYGGYGT